MELVCKECGKEFYISEEEPQPELEDLECDDCGGDVDHLIELTKDDLPSPDIQTGTVVDYEDLDDVDEDPKISMSS